MGLIWNPGFGTFFLLEFVLTIECKCAKCEQNMQTYSLEPTFFEISGSKPGIEIVTLIPYINSLVYVYECICTCMDGQLNYN